MIKFNIKLIAIIVALLVHLPIMAYDLEIDGIYYDLDIVNKTVSVTSGNKKYSGDVIIPSTVTYSNQTLIVTDIGNSAFYECTGLKSIYIPNSIPKIGSKAFRGCSSLESITIPNSITEIASQTFYGCSSLESVEIPNSVTKIGDSAFLNCRSLVSVEIPNSITEIESGVFMNCSSLVSVNIPISVSYIESFTFSGCRSLKSVEIPNSITRISLDAFEGCSSLETVVIPNSVNRIVARAFNNCTSLKNLIFEDGEDKLVLAEAELGFYLYYLYFGQSPLETLYLGRNLEYKYNPFNDNTGFKTVSLGEYVTDATSLSLSKSEGLETITCYNPNPPRIRDFTNFQYATLEVIVPNGALDAYKSANVWKNFWNLREAETSAIGDVLSDGTFKNGTVDVYDLSGRLLKRQASEDDLQDIRPGIYIFRQGTTSKKILIQ